MQNINYNPDDIQNYINSMFPVNTEPTVSETPRSFYIPSQSRLDTPEEIAARMQARQQTEELQRQDLIANTRDYSNYGINYDVNGDGKVGIFEGMTLGGLFNNIGSFGKESLTGLVSAATHPLETGRMIGDWATNTYYKAEEGLNRAGLPANPYTTALASGGYALGDLWNAAAQPYSLDAETMKKNYKDLASGKATVKDITSRVTHRGYEQSGPVALDALTLGAGKLMSGVTKGGVAATKASNIIASSNAKVAQQTQKIARAGQKVGKIAKNKSELAEAIKAAEQTGDWSKISPELKNALKEYSRVTDETFQTYSPATRIDAEEMAIVQKFARDNNTTYQQAERIIKPILDEANNPSSKAVNKGFHYSPKTDIKEFSDDFSKAFSGRAEHGEGLYLSTVEDTARNYTKIFDEQAGKAGRLYEIELPSENSLLKESLPFSQQSRDVKRAVTKLSKNNKGLTSAIADDVLGADIYKAISKDAKEASRLLEQNGVKGLKYYEGTPSEGITLFNPKRNAKIVTGEVDRLKNLELLAKDDRIAEQVLNSKKLFDKGDIFPITHGLAEVDKSMGIDNIGRVMAGRFSTRAFGNAAYEAIAKEVLNPNDYINVLSRDYLEKAIKDILRNGGTSDIDIRPTNPKDALYISREILEDSNKGLTKLLEEASSAPLSPDDIAIDKAYINAIRDQFANQMSSTPFGKNALGDLYNIRKGTALASGGYLVGNLQTGIGNAFINSNVGLFDDLINATLTKGKLAKELGVFRSNKLENKNVTKVGRAINDINLKTGGYLLQEADAKMQNLFAEVAAHSKLRRQGIKPSERLSAVTEMEGQKLGELINDVKLISLINPSKTILPKSLHGFAGIINPFWRWVDTAAQSSLLMLRDHPILANAVLFDTLARAGYDQELQRRLDIGVELDKPFVSYKVNPKTGEPREMSMEFLPQMNTLKVGSELLDIIKGKGDMENYLKTNANLVPLIGPLTAALAGVNKYGKVMYRDSDSMFDSVSEIGGKRYRLNPMTGMPEPYGGQLDEVITALANETIGSLSFANKTLLPSIAGLASNVTGKDYEYYMPRGQALFGTLGEAGVEPSGGIPLLISGDPTRPRSGNEIGNMLRGIYESAYYPTSRLEQGYFRPAQLKEFYKNINRRDLKEFNILMNR